MAQVPTSDSPGSMRKKAAPLNPGGIDRGIPVFSLRWCVHQHRGSARRGSESGYAPRVADLIRQVEDCHRDEDVPEVRGGRESPRRRRSAPVVDFVHQLAQGPELQFRLNFSIVFRCCCRFHVRVGGRGRRDAGFQLALTQKRAVRWESSVFFAMPAQRIALAPGADLGMIPEGQLPRILNESSSSSRAPVVPQVLHDRGEFQRADVEPHHAQLSLCDRLCHHGPGIRPAAVGLMAALPHACNLVQPTPWPRGCGGGCRCTRSCRCHSCLVRHPWDSWPAFRS